MAPDATIDLRSTPTPTTPAPPPAPALSDLYGDTGGLVSAPPTAAHQGVGHGASGTWDETLGEKVKSRISEPVKQSEIEKIPGLQPDVVTQLSEKGQDTLGSLFGKERADYLREHILHGFTPEVTARAAAKTLTDWYSPEMQAISAPGRVAHGYAAAADLADKAGEVEKAGELANKARLTGILGTATGMPLVGKQATDLAENWKTMSPTERAAAISGIVGGTVMTGVGAASAKTQSGAPKAEATDNVIPNHITFNKLGGKELRGPNSFGRTGGSFGRTVDTTFDVIRKSEAEKATEPTIEHVENAPPFGDTSKPGIKGQNIARLMQNGKEAGRVNYKIEGDTAAITGAYVDPKLQGAGYAQKMYLEAAAKARDAGATSLTSDLQGSTSMDAARVWDSLTRKGYPIEKVESKAGSPGYKMDLTKPQVTPEAPDKQFESTLARRGQMPNQDVNLSPAYGDTGGYVGGHVEARVSGATREAKQQRYVENLGVTHGTDLLDIPQDRMVTGGTKQDVITHEVGHVIAAHLMGISTEGVDIRSHMHPEIGPTGAAAATHFDWTQLPGSIKVKGGVAFTPEGLKSAFPKLLHTLLGGGVAQELVHDMPIEENKGMAGDMEQIRRLGRLMGFSTREMDARIQSGTERTRELLNKPEILDIIKKSTAEREEGLSKTLHMSADKVQDIVRQIKETQNVGTKTTDTEQGVGARPAAGTHPRTGEDVARGAGAVSPSDAGRDEPVQGKLFSKKVEEPAYHPDLQKVVDKFGTSDDASEAKNGASFIAPDGKYIHLKGTSHDAVIDQLGLAKGTNADPRVKFLNDTGAIRVRHQELGREGPTTHIAVPAQGATESQIPAVKRAVALSGRNGNVVMERADVGADTKDELTMSKEFPRPADAEDYLHQIQAHPDQHGAAVSSAVESSKKAAKPVETEPWHDEAAKSMAANGAFTINPRTGVMPESGHLLEAVPEVRQVSDKPSTAEEIKKFADTPAVAKLLKKYPELQVGGYKNDAGKYELNLSAASQDPAAAKDVATKLDQESTWDAGEQKLNPAGGKNQKTSFPDYSVEQRLRDLAPKEPGSTISTRFPTAVAATEDAMRHNLTLGAEHLTRNPVLTEKWANAVKDTPGFKAPEGADAKGTINAFVGHVKDNLKWLYNQSSPEEQKANQGWYEGAHQITKDLAAEHGYTHSQTAGVMASLSPQKDWDMNVSLAKRLTDIVKNKQNEKATPEMITKGKSIIAESQKANPKANGALERMLDKLKGKKLSQLTDPIQKAAWVRLYDETNNSREFEVIGPDGKPRGMRKNADGSPGQVGWGSFNEINKAMDILADGSRENISKTLGSGAHKVRSFYNNIIEPNSPKGDVTVDTHAVAAGLLRPLSGMSKEGIQNFSGPSSSVEGLNGTYPLYHEAYTQAAKELDIEHPRQLQSVVWEKIRNLFPSEFKNPENNAAIDAIWKEHENGKITTDQAREQVLDYAKSHAGVSEGERAGNQQGELSGSGVSGEPSRTGRRAGSGIAMGSSPEGVGDTSFDFGANVAPEPASKPSPKSKGKFNALDLMKGLKGLKTPGGK